MTKREFLEELKEVLSEQLSQKSGGGACIVLYELYEEEQKTKRKQ